MIPKRYRVVVSNAYRAIELLKERRIVGVHKNLLDLITPKVACRVIAIYGDIVILKH